MLGHSARGWRSRHGGAETEKLVATDEEGRFVTLSLFSQGTYDEIAFMTFLDAVKHEAVTGPVEIQANAVTDLGVLTLVLVTEDASTEEDE